ncbi:MAG: hypothetical protein CBB70_12920, partial [Planctomycetaceae bacterium TMED10]
MFLSISPLFRVTAVSSRQMALGICSIFFALHAANAAPDKPTVGPGVLPSEKPVEASPVRPREILAEVGIGPAELKSIHHTESAFEESNTRTLILQLLYRVAAMPERNLEYWANENSKTETLSWNQSTAIGGAFSLKGQVKQIDAIALSEKDLT